MDGMARILVVDNYDSFVYNLVQYLAQIGADVDVWRNDDPRFAEPGWADGLDGILLSPGPGTPERAGACIDVVRSQAGKLPIFGVCLGLQAMSVAFGGEVNRAPELLHGKTSLVRHDGKGVFKGVCNACLIAHRNRGRRGRQLILSAEDLANVGPIALPQDLAVVATLGIAHVERNGHHYFRGMSSWPFSVQDCVLRQHADLYRRHELGFPVLDIKDGKLSTDSVLRAPFGSGCRATGCQLPSLEEVIAEF